MLSITFVILLVIQVVAVLFFKDNKRVSQTVSTLILLVVMISAIFTLLLPTYFISVMFPNLIDGQVDAFKREVQMNKFVCRIVSIILVMANVYAWSLILSMKTSKRTIGMFLVGFNMIAFQLFCYGVMKKSGDIFPFKRCAENLSGGYEYVDADYTVHPSYNTKVCDCTEEMVRIIEGKGVPPIERMEINLNTRFFSNDNRPLVWYYQYSGGRLEFFNHPGVHPQFGTPLLPVSKAIVEQAFIYLEQGKQNMIGGKMLEAISTRNDSKIRHLIGGTSGNGNQGLPNWDSALNVQSRVQVSVVAVGELNDQLNSLSSQIASLYAQKGLSAGTGLFRNSFIATSGFRLLSNGDSEIMGKLKLNRFTSYLIIAKLVSSFREGTLTSGTVICKAVLEVSILSTNSQNLNQNFSIHASANGASGVQAKQEALEKIMDIYLNSHSTL